MQRMWDRIATFRLLKKARSGILVSPRKLRRLIKKTKLQDMWQAGLPELEKALREERKKYKEAKQEHAADWRRQHVRVQLRIAKRKMKRSPKMKERFHRLRRMLQREEARRRRRARGKGSRGGLCAIQVPSSDDPETLVMVTERQLVEQACMEENSLRYDQTRFPYATPPMKEPLYTLFNGANAEQNSDDLLRGALPLPDIDAQSRAFLQQCRYHREFTPDEYNLTTADHIWFWSRSDETKGSEPHGLHNGHFKAGAQSPLLAYCDTVFRRIPLDTGMVPVQWRHLMNFAIEKKPGDFRPSKMRTIQMMNSEFQANNKLVGRQAMRYAEANSLIPSGQCGSRKQHQAIDLALRKRLVWDVLILQRRAAGWISNDAKSCFDRIVHSVAIIALLRFGVLWRTLRMMFQTLAVATHRVRTGFGDSSAAFYPPSEIPYQGCGQGNGAGPQICVAVFSILVLMMEAAGFGFECLMAISSQLITGQCFSFVDDTEVMEAAKSVDATAETIFPKVQKAAILWSGGMQTTGGAINPEKSYWWLLDFEWHSSGEWKFRKFPKLLKDTTPEAERTTSRWLVPPLRIFGLSGELEALQRLEPEDSQRTLGVMLAPKENKKAQLTFVLDKAKEWAEKIRSGYLKPYDVFPVIRTTIMKSLEYPSPLTHLSYDEWTSVMSPILQVCLPKAGICRSFPYDVVFAPLKYQGLGLVHPFAISLFRQLDMLLRHPANQTKTSTYLAAVLQNHQLETGTSFGIFQQVFSNTAILASETWVKRCWEILEAYGIYLTFDLPIPTLRTTNDRLLMELLVELEVDQDVLKWMNWCRQYLRIATVSDMVTADGTSIRQRVWDGQRDNQTSPLYKWPRTVRPAAQHWDTWRETLKSTLTRGTLELSQPLHGWDDLIMNWNWLLSPALDKIFQRQGHLWIPYERISKGPLTRAGGIYEKEWRVWPHQLPCDIVRCSVDRLDSKRVALTGQGDLFQPQSFRPTYSILSALERYADECTSYYGWVPEEVQIVGSEECLAKAIVGGEGRVVSDGSYKDEIGTAGVIITTVDLRHQLKIRCRVPGLAESQSPYRSEAVGLLCGIIVSDWLIKEWGLKPTAQSWVRIACDGKLALEQSFGSDALTPTQPQFDILSANRGAIRASSLHWAPQHVDGHLDCHLEWEDLDWWERRNVEADQLAGDYRRQLARRPFTPALNPRFFTEPASVFIDNVKQQSLSLSTIAERVMLPRLRARWSSNKHWTVEMENEIDWEVVGKAMQGLRPGVQRWLTKHSVGICGVNRCLHYRKQSTTAKCPCCGQEGPGQEEDEETAHHVPRCMDSRMTTKWNELLNSLTSWLQSRDTDPRLTQLILHFLWNIRQCNRLPALPAKYQQLVTSQTIIGAQGLLEGRLSRHFRRIQSEHFVAVGRRCSVDKWARDLSQQLVLLGHAMWTCRY